MRRRKTLLNLTVNSKELQTQAHLSMRLAQFFKCLKNDHRNEKIEKCLRRMCTSACSEVTVAPTVMSFKTPTGLSSGL
jgi:hypothetical protein